jgi:hypothetical protein
MLPRDRIQPRILLMPRRLKASAATRALRRQRFRAKRDADSRNSQP